MSEANKSSEAREVEQQLIQELADIIDSFEMAKIDPIGEIHPTGIHTEKRVIIEGNFITVHVDCRDKSKHYQYKPETGIIKTIDIEIMGKDGNITISARKNEGKTTICDISMSSAIKNTGVPATTVRLYEAYIDGTVKKHNDGLDETALTGAIRKLSKFDTARVRKAPLRREESAAIQEAVARMVRSTLA